MSIYGTKLNPNRRLRLPNGAKGLRQSVVINHNPTTITQNEILPVYFPNLGENDVIVPGSVRVAFNLTVDCPDGGNKTTVYPNLGRNIVKKIEIKLSGNTIFTLDDADKFYCYRDLWRTETERRNMVYQGIHTLEPLNLGRVQNPITLPRDTSDDDKNQAIELVTAYGNRFCIPLDFEVLEAVEPFHQSGLQSRLEYMLTFNDYDKVVAPDAADVGKEVTYSIEHIVLEYVKVTDALLARNIRQRYQGKHVIYFNQILRCHHKIINKSDTLLNFQINTPAKSLVGILFLFVDPSDKNSEAFYNPRIKKIDTMVEGSPNQLYSQGMRPYQLFEEASKWFAPGANRDPQVGKVVYDTMLTNVTLGKYLTKHFGLWLDMRITDDNALHGSGRSLINVSQGVSVEIEKEGEPSNDPLYVYVYKVSDAQLNLMDGVFMGLEH